MKILSLCYLLLAAFTANLQAQSISLQQLNDDVTFLADDKLAGRAAFSQGIDEAADFIASRFNQIGLEPLPGSKSLKQSFNVYQINNQSLKIKLNNQELTQKDSIVLSKFKNLQWDEKSEVKIVTIGANDDFRKTLSGLNQQKTNLLVLIDPAHNHVFSRYQHHFNRGQTHFVINQGPSAVLLLTDIKQPKSFNLVAINQIKERSLTNVVGYLPSKSENKDSIVFSAHYDHIGLAHSDKAKDESKADPKTDKIFNGADDDASGTSAVIQLASYYSQQKNRQRNLIFAAFTAEEIGGFGSKYFSKQLDPDTIKAMVNIEMIGKPSKFGAGGLWMTGFDRSNLGELLNKNLATAQIHPDPYPKQNLFYRSDNATLARLGVPAHSFSSSQIDIDTHYHQVSDEVETLDLKSMQKVIETLAQACGGLVSGKDTPSRVDISHVKASGSFF